jgi:hypothetical protein
VLVAALLSGDGVPGDAPRSARARSPVEVEQRDRISGDLGELAVLEKHHVTRVLEDRRNVGGDQVFLLPEADDDRRRGLRGHQAIALGFAHHHDRERAVQTANRATRRFDERHSGFELLVHQVGDDFAVGLREKLAPVRHQLAAQLEVVLDDAIVDEHDAPGPMRVSVLLGRAAVRRPARVADAD